MYLAILFDILLVCRPMKNPRFSIFSALEKINPSLLSLYSCVDGWLVKLPLKIGLFSIPILVKYCRNFFFLFKYFILIIIGKPNQLGETFLDCLTNLN